MKTSINTTEIDRSKPLSYMTGWELIELMRLTLKEDMRDEIAKTVTSVIREEKVISGNLPEFMTIKRLAEFLGYSTSSIAHMYLNKEIPGSKKFKGKVLFDTEKILEWIGKESINIPTKDEQLLLLENNFSKRKMKKAC